MSKTKTVTLDVREDIRMGREPFSKIMVAVQSLPAEADLVLIAPFEPAPLYAVLGQQGMQHVSRELDSGDWEARFTRNPIPQPETVPAGKAAGRKTCSGVPTMDVDARGLEPPQPLVTILESLSNLPSGARLRAFTDRRPMHLYAQLESRGYVGETQEQPDGSFVTYVSRS